MTTDAAGAVALHDPSTIGALDVARQQARAVQGKLWWWPLGLVAAFAIVFSLRGVPLVWRLVLFLVPALPLLVLFTQTLGLVRAHRRLGLVERMLGTQPWRSAPVEVLSWGWTPLLEVSGIGHVRLADDGLCLRRTFELTRRADVVGPDPSGWVVLRVPDLCTPVLARRTTKAPAKPAVVPPPAAPVGSAAYPVLEGHANAVRRGALWVMAFCAVLTWFGVVVVALALRTEHNSEVHVAVGLTAVVVAVAVMVDQWKGMLVGARLPARLAAAPWSAFPTWLDAWNPGDRCVHGMLQLPDGRVFRYHLPRPDYDLVVPITTTGVVHVAGTPEVDAVLPVGVPERPVLGYIVFTAVGGGP